MNDKPPTMEFTVARFEPAGPDLGTVTLRGPRDARIQLNATEYPKGYWPPAVGDLVTLTLPRVTGLLRPRTKGD